MRIRSALLAAALAGTLALTSNADAQQAPTPIVVEGQSPAAQPPLPPGYVVAPGYAPPGYAPVYPGYPPGYGPGYTAPIYQQTQPSYIPQSVAFSGPRVINDWSEGEPVPPGYHSSTRVRKGLVVGGAVLFGTTYLLSALIAAVSTDVCNSNIGPCQSASTLFIPGVGPFIALGPNGGSATGDFFLVLDGLAQIGGLAMFTIGLASPKTVLVRNDLGYDSAPHLSLAPIFGAGRSEVGLVGTF